MKFQYSTYTLISESVISDEGFLQLKGDCEDLGFSISLPLGEGVYDKLIEIFKEKVDSYLKEKMNEDPAVLVVERFISSLDKIYKDMDNLKGNSNWSLILDVKLNDILQLYKQWIPITSLESLRSYYFDRYESK